MRPLIPAFILAAILPATVSPKVAIVFPRHEPWKAGTGRDKGAELAYLAGRPTLHGPYVFRVRMPAGFVFSPHVHNAVEDVTVISGIVMLGIGDSIDRNRVTEMHAGAFVRIPPGVTHYWIAKTAAVLQASGLGPRKTIVR